MQYRVRGAERESGAAVDRVIEAADEADARAQASGLGLMVEAVTSAAGDVAARAYMVRVLNTTIESGQDAAAVISAKLESMLNELTGSGWEFVSVQSVPMITLAARGGTRRVTGDDIPAHICLAVFRRAG